jgi:hypothetical protein
MGGRYPLGPSTERPLVQLTFAIRSRAVGAAAASAITSTDLAILCFGRAGDVRARRSGSVPRRDRSAFAAGFVFVCAPGALRDPASAGAGARNALCTAFTVLAARCAARNGGSVWFAALAALGALASKEPARSRRRRSSCWGGVAHRTSRPGARCLSHAMARSRGRLVRGHGAVCLGARALNCGGLGWQVSSARPRQCASAVHLRNRGLRSGQSSCCGIEARPRA